MRIDWVVAGFYGYTLASAAFIAQWNRDLNLKMGLFGLLFLGACLVHLSFLMRRRRLSNHPQP